MTDNKIPIAVTVEEAHALAFGCRRINLDAYPAAWGARAICRGDGFVDLLQDRMDAFGSQADKDRLFAGINLDPDELTLYEGVYRHVAPQAPVPDLVIYLQASPATLLERVRRRRVDYERGLALDYLTRLSSAYAAFFHEYTAAPLLIVNSDKLNFVDRDSVFELLLHRMRSLKGPREYFSLG